MHKIILFVILSTFLFSCTTSHNFFRFIQDNKKQEIQKTVVKKPKKEIQKKVQPKSKIQRKTAKLIKAKLSKKLKKYCKKIQKKFGHYGWGYSKCQYTQWHHVRNSFLGTPLIWIVYGSEKEHKIKPKDTTLLLCTVHGDEITPAKFCFDAINDLRNKNDFPKDKLVVIAPIVAPDSFLKKRPTRTNYRGVDVNRNFPTKDWNRDALRLWKKRYRSDKRRYPGPHSKSEAEVVFQMNLIKRYKPDKIISVHSPLTMLDYDGPFDKQKAMEQSGFWANRLLIKMSKSASGYRIKNYPYFPGSLGNWAGKERNIPTYTLELPSSDARKHKVYWKLFKKAIYNAFFHDFKKNKIKQKIATTKKSGKTNEPIN